MTVRRLFFTAIALAALLWGAAGCSEGNGVPTLVETDEPFFVQAMQLKKQGRHGEALTAFLTVIDKRGMQSAPESHLEAAVIYLQQTKDPLEAYHHFRKYLELRPNSREAEGVRGMVKIAMREFARQIPGRPLEDQSVRLQVEGDIVNLRRENEELRAELATLRGGGATPVNRLPRMITLPAEALPARSAPPPAAVVDLANGETPPRVTSSSGTPLVAPKMSPPNATKSGAMARPPTNAATGRRHIVAAGESLFAIGRKYGVRADAIAAANRDRLPAGMNTKLSPGMELKIP